MKKIFTFLFATSLLTTAFAQYDPKGDWDNNRGDGFERDNRSNHDKYDEGFKGTYYFTAAERDMQIAQINREYDYKIRSVKSKFFMDRFQKMRQVKYLEEQKYMRIQSVLARFGDRRNQFRDNSRKYHQNW